MNDEEFGDILVKFRGEPASILGFNPCIEALIDRSFCERFARLLHQPGVVWERRIAAANLGSMLPDDKGLYMFVWCPEFKLKFAAEPLEERIPWVLYVGKAGQESGKNDTIRNRYISEYSKYVAKDASCLWDDGVATTRTDRMAKYLTLRPLEFWYLAIADANDIVLFERKLIRMFRPPLNTQHAAILRPGRTVSAF